MFGDDRAEELRLLSDAEAAEKRRNVFPSHKTTQRLLTTSSQSIGSHNYYKTITGRRLIGGTLVPSQSGTALDDFERVRPPKTAGISSDFGADRVPARGGAVSENPTPRRGRASNNSI